LAALKITGGVFRFFRQEFADEKRRIGRIITKKAQEIEVIIYHFRLVSNFRRVTPINRSYPRSRPIRHLYNFCFPHARQLQNSNFSM